MVLLGEKVQDYYLHRCTKIALAGSQHDSARHRLVSRPAEVSQKHETDWRRSQMLWMQRGKREARCGRTAHCRGRM